MTITTGPTPASTRPTVDSEPNDEPQGAPAESADATTRHWPQPPWLARLPRPRLRGRRVRSLRLPTWPGAVAGLVGFGLTGLGALVDAIVGETPGAGMAAGFLLSCVVVPTIVARRSLVTAVVLPPTLFAVVLFVSIQASGQDNGTREVVLDLATTLALSAPVLFGGTALAVVIVTGRLVSGLFRRPA